MLSVALLAGFATEASAQGSISGRVTSSTTGLGLPNTVVQFYELDGITDGPTGSTTVDGLGNYSISLPAGSYGVLTQNTQGYINEIFDNLPCSAVCDIETLLTGVIVTNGSSFTADFALDPGGGRIAGRVTDSVTGLGIANVTIYFIPSTGQVAFTTAITDALGNYLSNGGTVTGTVYAATYNTLGYQNEAWDDVKCGNCDLTSVGTPMPVTIGVTTGGYDFALDPGGRITGTVRDVTLAPLANIEIRIYDSTGNSVEGARTDASGAFSSGGLLSGNYYVGTRNALGFVDEIWNNIPCANGNCNPTAGGTLVAVTFPDATGNIHFILQPGGRITGTVTNAVGGAPLGVFVGIHDAAGVFIGGANTDDITGEYTVRGVPPGTHYAFVNTPGFFNQMYNNLTCPNFCPIVQSTPIHVVAGATTGSINFALVPTTAVGSISGTVTDTSTGLPVNALQVQIFTSVGTVLSNVNTNASGVYTFPGLAAASYYVRTNGGNQLINQLHNGVICLNCSVATSGGTLVPVTSGGTATIDFALSPGGRISGTVTNATVPGPLQNVGVQLFSATGVNLGTFTTNVSGVYTTRGLPDGTYYLRTSNTQGFVDKLFDNLPCPGAVCPPTTGTAVVVAGTGTVGTRNFALSQGGRISGTVTNAATGAPLQSGFAVQVYTEAGVLAGQVGPDASGNYLTLALPAGRYYIRSTSSAGFIDELYDNLPCVGVCSVTAGTSVDVTVGVTATGRNFALSQGGHIAGTVRDAVTTALLPQIRVAVVLADGTIVKTGATNANGVYSITGLLPGTYYVRTSVASGVFYLDELWSELPCSPTCTVTDGAPVEVTAGVTSGGKNFTLTPGGGAFSGTVRDAATGLGLGGANIIVQAYLPNGTLVKTVGLSGTGAFVFSLPAGTYYARTVVPNAGAYLDELFNEKPCTPSCDVTTGDLITVANAATQGGIDFTLAPNLVRNGRFESATTTWSLFATPDLSYIVSQVTGGVFEYYRVPPPPGTSNQAVIFQVTGAALAANSPLIARFSLGNSSSARKRISVLVLDSDFSDLSVCTFWLAPNTPLAAYQMRTHTTKAWTNAAIYFYAASAGTNGGFYRVDDVSLESAPAASSSETMCVDPTAPIPPGGPDGPEMLVNGNFNTGTLAPWGIFGTITQQIVGGVFQFIKPNGTPPAGVVLQITGQALPGNEILTATFDLGNSSTVRKRVTVILHDNNFTDLSACTFWLAPNQLLSAYTYRTFTTQPWTNATLSVYPATVGLNEWILLDNATLKRTPASPVVGTECLEPGSGAVASIAVVSGTARSAPTATTGSIPRLLAPSGWIADGFARATEPASAGVDSSWVAVARSATTTTLQLAEPLDLTRGHGARLRFQSLVSSAASSAAVEVSTNGIDWITVRTLDASDDWTAVDIDLGDYAGEVVFVRFVFKAAAPADGEAPAFWRIGDVRIERTAPEFARRELR